jgi:hypothetical protein
VTLSYDQLEAALDAAQGPAVTQVPITEAALVAGIAALGVTVPFVLSELQPYDSCSTDDFNLFLSWWRDSRPKHRLDQLYQQRQNACIFYAKAFAAVAEMAGVMSVGMLNNSWKGHAYNIYVDPQGKAWTIEPQYGTYVGVAPPGGEVGSMDPALYEMNAPHAFEVFLTI